jgi:hypothetical protein
MNACMPGLTSAVGTGRVFVGTCNGAAAATEMAATTTDPGQIDFMDDFADNGFLAM